MRASLFGWPFGRLGQHAVTINGSVHLTSHAPELDSDQGILLVGHELFHVVQQREVGWGSFLARYLWNWRHAQTKNDRQHSMKRPAYER